jgi:hypothetical protein
LKGRGDAMTIAAHLAGQPASAPRKELHMTQKQRRRRGALIAGLAFLFSSSIVHADDRYTAGDMLTDCQAIVQASKTAGNQDELELDNTFATGTCWGAFLSLQQFAVTKFEGGKSTLLHTCVPQNATLLQLIQVFYLFAKSNPERQQEPFTKVAVAALRSAFPCKG